MSGLASMMSLTPGGGGSPPSLTGEDFFTNWAATKGANLARTGYENPSFLQNVSSVMMKNPWEVLADPDEPGMNKFMSLLMSSKGQIGGVGFQGPNADTNPYLQKLIAQMTKKGDRNPSKTTDASASFLLNKASPPLSMNTDPLRALSMMPRISDFTGWGG